MQNFHRVCILAGSVKHGGTDSFVINLATGLKDRGYDVEVVIATVRPELHTLEHMLTDVGIDTIHTCDPIGLQGRIMHLLKLHQHLRVAKPEVFQTNLDLFNGPNLFVAKLAGVPIRECHSHSTRQGRELRYGKTLGVSLYQLITRWMCWTFSNRRGGCSKEAMSFIYGDKWKHDEHSSIVYNGIDLDRYKNVATARESDHSNCKNICAIGNISYPKNPLFIVEIMKYIREYRKDIKLLWAGSGEMEGEVRQAIAAYDLYNTIELLGYVDDVGEVLAKSKALILPSLYEGLPYVLLEAQAAGVPCVVSKVVTQEVNCGGCTFLSLEDAREWADNLIDLLDNKMRVSIDQEQLQTFSTSTMVEGMAKLLS